MISILAIWAAASAATLAPAPSPGDLAHLSDSPSELAAPERATAVRGIEIRSNEGMTEVVVQLDGPARHTDYLLDSPVRLVLDVAGARHALPQDRFPGVNRGGVLGVRTSQFSRDVVRVVLELQRPVRYSVSNGDQSIRLTFENPGGDFEPWRTGSRPEPAQASPPRETQPQERAPARPLLQQQPRITVTFEETPIRDVVALFSQFAGRSIVIGRDITGTVTASITDQPWDIALQAILQSQGLAAMETESGIIRVEGAARLREAEREEEMVTRQFRIRYVSVDSIRPAIADLLTEDGRATRSASTNSLIITDRRSVVERLVPLIEQLDVRTPQVTVSAKIIFVDRTAIEELGIVYDIKDSRGNQLNEVFPGFRDLDRDGVIEADEETDENVVLLGGSSIAALANANNRVAAPALQVLTSLVLGRHSLVGFLEALQTLSLTDIQAVPTIKTMDNREARVQVGERTPIRVLDASAGAGGEGGPRATVNIQETGIILRVTPHVTGNQVLLDINAERSNIALAPSDIGVTFQTQEAQTQVLVNDGETAVISGLTLIEKTQVRSGIPILMDLPVLGALFRTTQTRENKRDLLIMVTPHIDKTGTI